MSGVRVSHHPPSPAAVPFVLVTLSWAQIVLQKLVLHIACGTTGAPATQSIPARLHGKPAINPLFGPRSGANVPDALVGKLPPIKAAARGRRRRADHGSRGLPERAADSRIWRIFPQNRGAVQPQDGFPCRQDGLICGTRNRFPFVFISEKV